MEISERVKLSSIPLQSIQGRECKPTAMASGCIVQYPKNDYLFTVFHAVSKNEGTWAMLSEWISGKGTKYYTINGFTYLRLSKINRESDIDNILKNGIGEEIDFAFTVVPKDVENLYQEIGPDMRIIKSENRLKFHYNEIATPNQKGSYGFSGQIMPEIIGNVAIAAENMVYMGLKYLRTEGNFHFFELPFEHPGHEYFQGCSGAPIIDKQGNLVSLVCSSDEPENGKIPNRILGINLEKFKIAIEIEEGTF